ncbi:MAG: CRP/FNR family putative post-exponential-phase nitrogen-starvation transcriptional regulator [Cellvibrionaceae bacterium]
MCAYEKGEYLAREGEKSESFFLLVSGKLQVGYLHQNGHQAVFAFETPLSIIGDIELFEDRGSASNINVQAVEDSLLLVTTAKIVREHGSEDARFLRFLLRYLARKIDFSSTLLSQVSLSAENRLARYLLGRMRKDGRTFQLEKREALAALLGTSVRHLNRTFKSLCEDQMIALKSKTVEILDPAALNLILEKES